MATMTGRAASNAMQRPQHPRPSTPQLAGRNGPRHDLCGSCYAMGGHGGGCRLDAFALSQRRGRLHAGIRVGLRRLVHTQHPPPSTHGAAQHGLHVRVQAAWWALVGAGGCWRALVLRRECDCQRARWRTLARPDAFVRCMAAVQGCRPSQSERREDLGIRAARWVVIAATIPRKT